jgi:hypothetical protein
VEDRDANSRFLAAHPGRFAFATLSRIVNYWTAAWLVPTPDSPNQWPAIIGISSLSLLGMLGLRTMFSSGNPAAMVYAGCLFIYPVVYYVTTTQPRFYHAITPLLILLSAFQIVDWKNPVAAPVV